MTETRPVLELRAREIGATGVAVVSGLMAEDTSILTSEIVTAGISYQPAKHENVAVNVADGYAWATGVVLVGRGPGLANAATALATLALSSRATRIRKTMPSDLALFRPSRSA